MADERREMNKGFEARRLLAHLTKSEIQEMAGVGGIYLQIRALNTALESRDVCLEKAMEAYHSKLLGKEVYMTKGRDSHVSSLRMEAAIGLYEGKYGGLESVRLTSGTRLAYPLPNAPRQGVLFTNGASRMPDYDKAFPGVGGRYTEDHVKVESDWDKSGE